MAEELSREEVRRRAGDRRYTEVPQPCMHCTHLKTVGSQFSDEGWTCAAYPNGIPYFILNLYGPHFEPNGPPQSGLMVAYDPVIYTEEDTGRKWHYTADARWVYVEEETD